MLRGSEGQEFRRGTIWGQFVLVLEVSWDHLNDDSMTRVWNDPEASSLADLAINAGCQPGAPGGFGPDHLHVALPGAVCRRTSVGFLMASGPGSGRAKQKF